MCPPPPPPPFFFFFVSFSVRFVFFVFCVWGFNNQPGRQFFPMATGVWEDALRTWQVVGGMSSWGIHLVIGLCPWSACMCNPTHVRVFDFTGLAAQPIGQETALQFRGQGGENTLLEPLKLETPNEAPENPRELPWALGVLWVSTMF